MIALILALILFDDALQRKGVLFIKEAVFMLFAFKIGFDSV